MKTRERPAPIQLPAGYGCAERRYCYEGCPQRPGVGAGRRLASGASWKAVRGAMHAADGLNCELKVLVLGGPPCVHDCGGAFGRFERGRTDHHIVGASQHNIGLHRGGVDFRRVFLGIGQVSKDRFATGSHIDLRGRRIVPDNHTSLAGRKSGNVVSVRGEGRLAALG